MSKPAPGSPPRRIGLRAVAEAAGVCLMTASLALRNSPRLSPATGKRVRDLAASLGYRPDPELARLMGRLRPSRVAQGSVVLAMIDLHRTAEAGRHPYDTGVRQGITIRAQALGYGVSLFRIRDYEGGMPQLLRVLRHRGIVGVVLLPSGEPVSFDPALPWDGFSVVAATTTVTAPQFHQVVPNQLHNMMELIADVHARGFRKLAAVFGDTLERRTHHAYSMALAWHGHRHRILVLPEMLSEPVATDRVRRFLLRHSPDLIFGGDAMTRLLPSGGLKRLLDDIEIVALTSRPAAQMSYLDQQPQLIGESAVRLLTGMMHHHETGIPAAPQVTTIRGVLRETTVHQLRITRPPVRGRGRPV